MGWESDAIPCHRRGEIRGDLLDFLSTIRHDRVIGAHAPHTTPAFTPSVSNTGACRLRSRGPTPSRARWRFREPTRRPDACHSAHGTDQKTAQNRGSDTQTRPIRGTEWPETGARTGVISRDFQAVGRSWSGVTTGRRL